jgi:hypothetical protein
MGPLRGQAGLQNLLTSTPTGLEHTGHASQSSVLRPERSANCGFAGAGLRPAQRDRPLQSRLFSQKNLS